MSYEKSYLYVQKKFTVSVWSMPGTDEFFVFGKLLGSSKVCWWHTPLPQGGGGVAKESLLTFVAMYMSWKMVSTATKKVSSSWKGEVRKHCTVFEEWHFEVTY